MTRILLGKLRKYHREDPQLLVFSRDFIGEEIFAYGVYEKNDINVILNALDFDTKQYNILDIGANIGNHAVQFSKYFNNVHCFEPNPLVYEVLKLNTRNASNIVLHPFGLSDKTAILNFSNPIDNIGGGGITTSKENTTQTITVKKGDDVVTEEFSVIKIDVEGHEFEAIAGLEIAIKKHKPVICFELINNDPSALNIINKLKELGYIHFYVPKRAKLFGFSVNSFSLQFLANLFSLNKQTLVQIEEFDKKFYNLIICETPDSKFRIKKIEF